MCFGRLTLAFETPHLEVLPCVIYHIGWFGNESISPSLLKLTSIQ